jgi:hypothetical protein
MIFWKSQILDIVNGEEGSEIGEILTYLPEHTTHIELGGSGIVSKYFFTLEVCSSNTKYYCFLVEENKDDYLVEGIECELVVRYDWRYKG